jgi:hypothetical protein
MQAFLLLLLATLGLATAGTTVHVNWPTDFVLGTYLYQGGIGTHHFPWDPPSTDYIVVHFPQLPVDAALFSPAVIGLVSETVQAVAHVSTSGSCRWNAPAPPPPALRGSSSVGAGWGPQYANCTETAFTGSQTSPTDFTITVHNANQIETLRYIVVLYYGCKTGFPADNSLCSPVKLLPKGIYESACAYNLTQGGAAFTAKNGCGCLSAQQNYLGCWDKSGLSQPPVACSNSASSNVAGCSDCSQSCPQPQ